MILLRSLLWRLDTARRARRARREAAHEADLLAICVAAGILPDPQTPKSYVAAGMAELDHYLKGQTR